MTNHLLAPAHHVKERLSSVIMSPRLTPSTTDGVDGAGTGRFVNWHRHPRAVD